jgi:hypothetical protein
MNVALLPTCLATIAAVGHLATAEESPTGGRDNVLINPSFENGLEGWELSAWNKSGAARVDAGEARDGKASLRIENPAPDDPFVRQSVTVKPMTRYRLSAVIRTESVASKGTGATIALEGGFEMTESVTGRKGWKRVEFEFSTGPLNQIKIGPRLGHHSNLATGIAWYDDLRLVELGPARK